VVKVQIHILSTPELIRNKTAVFLHWCQLCAVPLPGDGIGNIVAAAAVVAEGPPDFEQRRPDAVENMENGIDPIVNIVTLFIVVTDGGAK
jgi:hypothetical protein